MVEVLTFTFEFRGHQPVTLPRAVVEEMELFRENRNLLLSGHYAVRSYTNPDIINAFLTRGRQDVVTNDTYAGLKSLCAELGWHAFDSAFEIFNQKRTHNLMSSPGIELKNILSNRDFREFFKAQDRHLIEFLVTHANELLELACTTLDRLGTIAYEVIVAQQTHRAIYSQIIAKHFMKGMAARVFTQTPNHVLISRFARISMNIAGFSQQGCLEVSQHMPEFIRYCEEPDVLDVFQTLLSDNEPSLFFQNCMKNCHFIESLSRSAKAIECPSHYGGRSLYCHGVFVVVALCAKTSILGPIVKRGDVITSFLKPQPSAPVMVQKARWNAYVSLLTPENREAFNPVFDEAVSALKTLGPVLHPHQLSMIEFMMLISGISKSFSRRLVEMNIASLLLEILNRFPNHTIGFKCVRQCLMHSIGNEILGPHIWAILSVMADKIVDRGQKNFLSSCCCLGFFLYLHDKAKKDERVKTIVRQIVPKTHSCWAIVSKAYEIESHEYGGSIPRC